LALEKQGHFAGVRGSAIGLLRPPFAFLRAKQLVMVVAMHFDHFAIHHAFPAKLHSAFRITCATEKQNYRKNTEELIKVNKHNTHELQPQRHCLFIVCIDTTKLLQKM
jgi:hypothetical protein